MSPSVYPTDGCQLFGPGLLTLAKQRLVFVSLLLFSGLFTCCLMLFCCAESLPKEPTISKLSRPLNTRIEHHNAVLFLFEGRFLDDFNVSFPVIALLSYNHTPYSSPIEQLNDFQCIHRVV